MATDRQRVPDPGPDGPFGCLERNPGKCRACANAHGPAPWGDSPDKSHCLAYGRRLGDIEPDAVYFDGADCPFHIEEGGVTWPTAYR